MKRTMNSIGLASALGLALLATPALAKDGETDVAVRLAFPADASAEDMYATIQRVAKNTCRNRGSHPHGKMDRERACRDEFTDRAVAALDRDLLTAYHRDQIAGPGSERLVAEAGAEPNRAPAPGKQ